MSEYLTAIRRACSVNNSQCFECIGNKSLLHCYSSDSSVPALSFYLSCCIISVFSKLPQSISSSHTLLWICHSFELYSGSHHPADPCCVLYRHPNLDPCNPGFPNLFSGSRSGESDTAHPAERPAEHLGHNECACRGCRGTGRWDRTELHVA